MIDLLIGRRNKTFVTSELEGMNVFHFKIKYSRFVA